MKVWPIWCSITYVKGVKLASISAEETDSISANMTEVLKMQQKLLSKRECYIYSMYWTFIKCYLPLTLAKMEYICVYFSCYVTTNVYIFLFLYKLLKACSSYFIVVKYLSVVMQKVCTMVTSAITEDCDSVINVLILVYTWNNEKAGIHQARMKKNSLCSCCNFTRVW